MSWLYTIVFAGLMLSAEGGNLPISAGGDLFAETVTANAVADETERFEQTYPLDRGGRVSISNVNGSIAIETWERSEVKLEYVKTADTKESLAEVNVRIDARQDYFSVETDYGDWRRRGAGERRSYGKLQVEYRLTVPRGAALNEIETVNGSVSINGATNTTKASSVNGEVRALGVRGTASLSTVNGTVVAHFDQLQTGGKISLNTVNGTVDLMIPSDANATIKADTVNGSITNDFGLPVRKGEYVGRDLYGKVGSGDVQIRLNSVNGALSIKRRNDGRNVNRATDLLNLKNENDNVDWDDEENNSRAKPPKPAKPSKAPKPAKPSVAGEIDNEALNKSIEEGLKQAEKELEQINPELERQYLDAIRQAEKLNSEEMRARMKDAQTRYKDALAGMADRYFVTGSPVIEKKSGSFGVKGTPKVTVEAKNCNVFVRGWDKSEVSYSLVRVSRNVQKSAEKDSLINVKTADSTVDIKVLAETQSPDGEILDYAGKTRLEIYVPKKSNLKITTGGEIRLEGVSGEIDLQGADEAINVRDADGKLTVAAIDGRIRVIGFRGAFDGKTGDGAMNLEGDFQKFSAQTVDGTIVLTLPENANVNIESNSKQVIAKGFVLDHQGDGRGTSKWKIGNGGNNHRIYTTADGQVFIHSASMLKTN